MSGLARGELEQLLRDTQACLRESEARLRQAQKSEMMGRLAGGLAHDFNNILTVMVGYTDLALHDLRPQDPVRQDLEEVVRAGQRGTALTRQLRAFSGEQPHHPTVLDVGQVVTEMESLLQRLLGEQIELSLVTGFSSGEVLADQSALEQVILNLCFLARQAMPEGGRLSIEIADVERLSEGSSGLAAVHRVVLSVTDTGSGANAEAFDRFCDSPLSAPGLQDPATPCLATVLAIVDKLGGGVRVHSELARGTTFEVSLPRRFQGATNRASSQPPESLRGSESVLLVEDEEQVRALMGAVLRRQGYYVLEAQNGVEALLIYEQLTSPLHLLITDLAMPRIGGRELSEKLRALTPDLRVLYVSGNDRSAWMADSVLADSISFLPKPLVPGVLLARVRDLLDGIVAAR